MKAKKQNREPEFGMPRLIPFREKSKSAGIKFGKASTKGLPGLFSSFKYAASGFVLCVKRERNMRIHLSAAFYAFLFSLFYDFAPGDYALLAIVCGLVMFAECVNTAVESVCDLYTESYSEKVMCAKDIAAAAVLICASVAVLAGLFLFGDFETIKKIAVYFFYNPAALVLLAVSFVLDFFFIRSFKQAQKGD